MSRYVDVEPSKVDEVIETELGMYDTVELKEMLKYFPTADVAPVVHAHWIKMSKYVCDSGGKPVVKIGELYICSNCGLEEDKEYSYCHCGAKMDEEIKQ